MPCARKHLFLYQSQNLALLQLDKESSSCLFFTICFRTVHEKAAPSVSALSASVVDARRRMPKIALVILAMAVFVVKARRPSSLPEGPVPVFVVELGVGVCDFLHSCFFFLHRDW